MLIHRIFLKKTDLANLKSDVDKLNIDKLKNLPINLSNLKSKVDKLDVDKLLPIPVDLSKLSDVVKLTLLKKMYIMLRSKILKIKRLILATNTTLNTKINEVKNKAPSITNLVATTALNAKINEVKENKLEEAVRVFGGANIQISTEDKGHLGAVVGTEENKKNYINDKIREWTKKINMLADIATIHPQVAYTTYVTSYQHKLTYLLRTIPYIEVQLKKIDEVVRHKLIPAMIGGQIINDSERVILSLSAHLGGLGLKIFAETAGNEDKDSTVITSNLQSQILETNNNEGKTRGEIKAERGKRNQEKLRQFLATSDEKTKRMMETLNQKGVSNWLTNLPIKELGYDLTKQEFWDAIKIRYNWPLDRILSQCIC